MSGISESTIKVQRIDESSSETIAKAWTVSRPADLNFDIEQVIKMDVPVNEFQMHYFVADAPIAVREFLCSFRNHVLWARSSRVEDLTKWDIWAGLESEDLLKVEKLYKRLMSAKDKQHQDKFRESLPLSYMTKFSFGMNNRDIVKMLLSIAKLDIPVLKVFAHALLDACNSNVHRAYEEQYYAPHHISTDVPHVEWESHRIGEFCFASLEVSLGLRAQLVRHRAISFNDGFNALLQTDHWATSSMDSTIPTQIVMPFSFAKTLVSKRSCWIAQTDLWLPIINILRTGAIDANIETLPCSDGKCKFTRDNDLRKSAKDPSPPCPLFANLYNTPLTKSERAAALKYADQRPMKEFWKGIIG